MEALVSCKALHLRNLYRKKEVEVCLISVSVLYSTLAACFIDDVEIATQLGCRVLAVGPCALTFKEPAVTIPPAV